jgi:hypothetical protein
MKRQETPRRLPLSKFEAAVLEWIATRCQDPALKQQLADVEIIERDYTGAGCFSTLKLATGAPVSEASYAKRGPLDGPEYECPVVSGGTLLWFNSGRADCLEIYIYSESFPADLADIREFRLFAATSGFSS